MLDPRHRAVLLKEKYRQQVEQQDTDTENAETQAVGRVESRCGMGSRGAAGAKAAGTEEKGCRSRKDLRPTMRPGMKQGYCQSGGERRLRSVLPRKTPVRSRQLTTACQQRSSSLRPVVNSWWTSRKRSGGQSDRLRHPPQTRLRSMKQIGSLCPLRAQKCRAKSIQRAQAALCAEI